MREQSTPAAPRPSRLAHRLAPRTPRPEPPGFVWIATTVAAFVGVYAASYAWMGARLLGLPAEGGPLPGVVGVGLGLVAFLKIIGPGPRR